MVAPFVIRSTSRLPSTQLFLEDWVADMIDGELYRQSHKKEFEEAWMEKNRNAVLSRIETDFVNVDPIDDVTDFRMHRKDKRLAFKDPERYCADRCVATGNCDIFEDFYEMSPEQVIAFCTECVLSEDEDGECQIPDAFYDKPRP
ncbi:hypothetical protein IV203_015910 [Nitzschia inconspicua]|uniref:Uncharacterized protein n=1 Tax=Nitzschia inconspicua TaxID=303405 RepID=A0A9K3PU09_9STRA|nr:hypothetical protein IV203_015910 [Nitzschia inconspicua]